MLRIPFIRTEDINSQPVIALLTDFGLTDWFVGAMRGEILSRSPHAHIIDITHAVPPQNVEAGAFALASILSSLAAGTIICGVVDPGVGTARRAIVGRIGPYGWSGPDNGLATPLLEFAGADHELYTIERPPWRKIVASSTFHGRDMFAPSAAQLALRQDASQAGVRVLKPVLLPPEAPRESEHGIWTGRVVWIDHFGNCITNFNTEEFGERMRSQTFRLRLGPLTITRIEATYGSQKAGEPLAYWGSAGRLEIGINQGSAATRGELQVGNRVELEFRN